MISTFLTVILIFCVGCGALPLPTSPPAGQGANDVVGDTFEEDVELIRGLAEDYWARRFAQSGMTYRPLTRFVPYTGQDGPDCGGEPSLPNNAFYCPLGHFVAFDAVWLQELYDKMGDGSVYVIIPHEIGHAVQAQLMTDFALNKQRELQADCYAGGALGALVREGRLQTEPGDEEELLLNLADAADPTDEWWRPDAHGTARERQLAFARGYDGGVEVC